MKKKIAIVDFETEAIEGRPDYPPKPVGVSIKVAGKKSKYYGWGHPTNNNCTFEEGRAALLAVWDHVIVNHNSKFDLDVAFVHIKLPWPEVERFHDTMILAYLDNPHERNIDLKSLSVKHLGRPAVERDELKEWILRNVPGSKPSTAGAYICKAPGDLVGRYACADTDMTDGLLTHYLPLIDKAGMMRAYVREKALLQVLVGMESRGIPVDAKQLHGDVKTYSEVLSRLDQWVRDYLGVADPNFNIDSKDELADALDSSGKASNWTLTPTGKRSTAKDSIKEAINDAELTSMLDYRSTLANYLRNFMEPWDRTAQATGGFVYTQWHSTKQEAKGGSRTGRLSSTPNLQNVPSDERWGEANARFEEIYKKYSWLLHLPQVRNYVVAPRGYVLLGRDFSQQEMRVLAHFEDGDLCTAYQDKPRMDIYIFGVEVVQKITGISLHPDPKFARKIMKTVILALMYGLGLGRLAEKLEITVADATKFKRAILTALPGLKALSKDLQEGGKRGDALRTWGGRLYYSEPARIVKGRLQEYHYKLLNYLIQGSSADITKEAMIRYEHLRKYGQLVLSVHDELLVLCPAKHYKSEMKILQGAMDTVELDAPLVSDGFFGQTWGKLMEME